MPSSHPNEETLFHRALELPAAERADFLARECGGNDALRAAVASLLKVHSETNSFLEKPAPEISSTRETPTAATEAPGATIGRYKLLQKIGEGGCGVVFMADQEEPVRRRVALKVIKLGMDTKEVIARFEAERQALALMDHPNIARVLDAGATDAGRPFFVMELVRGKPLTKFCDEQNLPTRARLELFIAVCHAVQHAHQKGIIHRDLKPSNILVTLHDGVPVPKVIDFGIAKATQGRLTDATLFTAFEQFIGTPAYMSPEQAELSGLDIDTRSDIYSLGVLLYELLTGRPPFDPKSLLNAGLDEIRRIIREVDPPRPSTRLGTLDGETLTATARLRQISPPKLIHFIQGDLDWIVMRCLEKDRTRRYETANALAQDLQNFVCDEPVSARQPGPFYVLRKLARRHRIAVTGASAFLAVVVSGTALSARQLARVDEAHGFQTHDASPWRRWQDIRWAADFASSALLRPDAGVIAMLDQAAAKYPDALTGRIEHDSAPLETAWRDTLAAGYLATGRPALALPQAERGLRAATLLEQSPEPTPQSRAAIRRAHDRMVQVFRSWEEVEPGTGKAALAAMWQQKLDALGRAPPATPSREAQP